MKLRTELQLQEFLDGDLGWRIKEIDYTETAIRRATGSAQVALTRSGVALLYAHWEGFVKCSSEAFLNFVLSKNLKYKQLRPCFIAHGIAHQLELLSSSKRHDKRSEAITFIVKQLELPAKYSWQSIVRTEGNLNGDAFKNITAAIGLDSTKYETRFKWIDVELVARRNRIAHGERLEVAPSLFPTLSHETLKLLRWFKTDIENGAATKMYLTTP